MFKLEFINSLIESNQITENDLRDIINSIGVKNDLEMDIDDFEAVLEGHNNNNNNNNNYYYYFYHLFRACYCYWCL